MPRLWMIDDTEHWHAVAERTVQGCDGWEFEGFFTGFAAEQALGHTQQHEWPTAILMDFYLTSERGDEVTRRLRRITSPRFPIIIGHSTMPSGSRSIVAAGGNIILKKYDDENGINPALEQWLKQYDSK